MYGTASVYHSMKQFEAVIYKGLILKFLKLFFAVYFSASASSRRTCPKKFSDPQLIVT